MAERSFEHLRPTAPSILLLECNSGLIEKPDCFRA